MSLGGCGKFLKYSIFLVNLVIFITGLTVMGLGIWTLADKTHAKEFLGDNMFTAAAAILLVFGGIVAFISFLGCCGAIKEVKCLLFTFFIILLLITILIVLGVVFSIKMKDKVDNLFKEGLEETLADYNKTKDMKEAWDAIQKELKCCGVSSYKDWLQKANFTDTPDSCNCDTKADADNCQIDNKESPKPHWKKGCDEEIKGILRKYAKYLIGFGIFLAIIIILAMVFSCSLFMMI